MPIEKLIRGICRLGHGLRQRWQISVAPRNPQSSVSIAGLQRMRNKVASCHSVLLSSLDLAAYLNPSAQNSGWQNIGVCDESASGRLLLQQFEEATGQTLGLLCAMQAPVQSVMLEAHALISMVLEVRGRTTGTSSMAMEASLLIQDATALMDEMERLTRLIQELAVWRRRVESDAADLATAYQSLTKAST